MRRGLHRSPVVVSGSLHSPTGARPYPRQCTAGQWRPPCTGWVFGVTSGAYRAAATGVINAVVEGVVERVVLVGRRNSSTLPGSSKCLA